jgi:hypothetical protein
MKINNYLTSIESSVFSNYNSKINYYRSRKILKIITIKYFNFELIFLQFLLITIIDCFYLSNHVYLNLFFQESKVVKF